MNAPAYLPAYTEHGEACNASVIVHAAIDRVWDVVHDAAQWPHWNPLIEWTSSEIDGSSRDVFNILSARTLMRAEIRQAEPCRYLHWRCAKPKSPQPPAADHALGLVPRGATATIVLVQMSLEPWYRERLIQDSPMRGKNPALWYLHCLKYVVEPTRSGRRRRVR